MLKYEIPQIVTLTLPQIVTLTHDWEQFGNISDKKKKLSIELSIT